MKLNGGYCRRLLILATLCFARDVRGQTLTGAIVGHVADLQQATIGGSSLILHSIERDFDRQTNSNADGEFSFPLVPPGKITLTAEKSGFASITVSVEVVMATPIG